MSAAARKLRRAAVRRAATRAAVISGCTCNRDLVLHGVEHVTVRHDPWCPMIDHGSQLVVYRLPRGCAS